MNKDLKVLFISFGLLFGLVIVLYFVQERNCETVEYQDLQGTHTEQVCEGLNE
jgi:hypothetical protein